MNHELASRSPHSPRILRIGVLLGGNIVEERLVRKRETITIGQSVKNSFSIPIEGLPKTFPVFSYENGTYYLNFQDNMDGRISTGNTVHTLSQLKGHGAQRRGANWAFALDERARGKVSVGAMTMLFQFVTAPPISPRPRLPASVRGTLADRIEPRLALILTLSVLTHFAVGLYAYTRDQVMERKVDRVARSFQVGQYELPPEPPPVEVAVVVEAEEATAPKAAGTDSAKIYPHKETQRPIRETQQRESNGVEGSPEEASVAEAIQSTALVGALTGSEGPGGIFGIMTDTNQGAPLDASIAHVKGKPTATIGSAVDRRQRVQGTGAIGTGQRTEVEGPKASDGVAKKVEEKIKSRPTFGPIEELGFSDLDPAAVVKRIKGHYLAGIKHCHQRILKIDPRSQGKVTIRFTVAPTGRVTKARVQGFDPTVDACIRGQAAKWRFSSPKDEGKPTSADFEVPMLLKPGG